jgi:hypothetical protein
MKKELEVMIRNQKGNKKKPGICCITDDVEFRLTLRNLYSEGFTQLLCYGTPSSLLDVIPNSVMWENILRFEQLSEKGEKVIEPSSKTDLPQSPGSSITSAGPDKSTGMSGPFKKFVRVSRFSMAAHLNNLMKWKEDEANHSHLVDSPLIEDIMRNDDPDCLIEVSIDRDKRKQKIVISGKSEEITKAKVARVESLLAKLSANRKVLRLHGWKSPHREAMMGSNPLSTMSQSFLTTVVFHVTDGHIVAEMMSTNELGIARMSEYLKSLVPMHAHWKFDSRYLVPEPRVRFWNSIRNKYAVMFEKGVTKGFLEVQAWGFGELLQDAQAELQSAALGRPIPPSAIVSAKPEKSLRPPAIETFQVAEYRLQDSEAAHFYRCYENMFQCYFRSTHGVLVTVAPGSVSHSDSRDETLVLDIRGYADDISSARSYLDRIHQNLNRREVTIHVVNEEMYREIDDIQVTDPFQTLELIHFVA